jgi:hypothetical protein
MGSFVISGVPPLLVLLLFWTRIEPANGLVGHPRRNHNNSPPQQGFQFYGTSTGTSRGNWNGDRDGDHGGPQIPVHDVDVAIAVAALSSGMDDTIRTSSTTATATEFDCVTHPLGEDQLHHHDQSHSPQPTTQQGSASFQRDKQWLEKATARFLTRQDCSDGADGQQPQEQQQQQQVLLTLDDVHEIKGLMTAWARRGSPLIVESLLKRIIDDMRAGNTAIHVSTRFYAIVSNNTHHTNDT